MTSIWIRRIGFTALLAALSPACGDNAKSDKGNVSESPNLGETTKKTLTAADGGEVSLPMAGVTLSVPAGALATDTELTATVVAKAGLPEAAKLPGNVVEFGPDGLEFLKPVGLEIDLAGASVPRDAKVSISWLDEKTKKWVDLAGSKLSGTKVSAATMHFTKFVVRFTIDAGGNVTQESGQCDLSTFTPCGGSVEGTWLFEVGCVTLTKKPEGEGSGKDVSKCIAIEAAVDFTGEVTFTSGTVTGESHIAIDVTQTIDKACFADYLNANAGSNPQGTAADIPCSTFDNDDDEGEPVKAEDKGDTCVLHPPGENKDDPIDGTYTTEGNTLTITDNDAGDGGPDDGPDVHEYCVSGDTLTLVTKNGGDGTSFMIVAKRK